MMVYNVAAIGECMIELRQGKDGKLTRSFGGDSLNTAIYLSRLGIETAYFTALGDDQFSDEMVAAWQAEGVDTSFVQRKANRLPGLYMVQTEKSGERHFTYWRSASPARDLFAEDDQRLMESLLQFDWIYFTGISMSLYGAEGRQRLFDYLQRANDVGAWIVFDTNFRKTGWPDMDEAQSAFRKAIEMADILFASHDDMSGVFGHSGVAVFDNAKCVEKVLKLPDASCRLVYHDKEEIVAPLPVKEVVDTTAAGDSFAAAYLAARIAKKAPLLAAADGHRLANKVIQNPGAIIPKSKMPKFK